MDILILGSGFTGRRVAERMLRRGAQVMETHRHTMDFTQPGAFETLRQAVTPGCLVLHSVPPLDNHGDLALLAALGDLPRRVLYLSTTGVYGNVEFVDENTPVQPTTARTGARIATEQAVQNGPWSALILRPAAIYGPGRGAHVALLEGRYRLWGDGSNFISRIHVADLATHVEAALLSDITGAYPVADEHPCTSREIAEFCSQRFGLPMPAAVARDEVPESRRANRRVDGSAIRRILQIRLQYPSYRTGIPASA